MQPAFERPALSDRAVGSGRIALARLFWAHLASLAFLLASAIPRESWGSPGPAVFAAAAVATQAGLLALAGLGLAWAGTRLNALTMRSGQPPGALRVACSGWIVLPFAAIVALVWADLRLYDLFGFHFNGFVWNIVTTPGGITATGADAQTFHTLGEGLAALLLAEGLLYASAFSRRLRASPGLPRLRPRTAGLCIVACFLVDRGVYAWGDLTRFVPVLRTSESIPFYVPIKMKGLARKLGFEAHAAPRRPGVSGASGVSVGTPLRYPLHPLVRSASARSWNLLWLCSESLRADALRPDVMPRTFALAQQGQWFRQHLSGGNGTRMGVFSMFYGLPGPYWFSVLLAQRGPVLISELRERGYQLRAFTSDDFSYPEFGRTVFVDLPPSERWIGDGVGGVEPGWQRDRRNVDAIEQFLDERDPAHPFFVFSFLESPHAPYLFPDEDALFRPYLESTDYVKLRPARDAEGLHNRYRNAVHHLDGQVARLLDDLERRGLADSTIVIVTGDHGEEFMEAGRWGHNSTFSEPQIRVPLVMRVPGRPPEVIDRMTSHADLPATLLGLLGVTNDPRDYSTGTDLFGAGDRDHAVVSDWNRIAFVGPDRKIVMPWRVRGALSTRYLTRSDQELEPDRTASLEREALRSFSRDLARFRQHR